MRQVYSDRAHQRVSTLLRRLSSEVCNDFIALGQLNKATRKLSWPIILGRINDRTLRIEQKPDLGLSGIALRSGRPSLMNNVWTQTERFKLNEPLVLTEGLLIAAAFPFSTNVLANKDKREPSGRGVLLIGRRSVVSYSTDELNLASEIAVQLTEILSKLSDHEEASYNNR